MDDQTARPRRNKPNSWWERGIQEGLQEGLQKGKLEEKENIVREMLKERLSVDLITKITGLDFKEIEHIKRTL